MKKKLKTTVILNELKGNSGFFQKKSEKVQSQPVFEAPPQKNADAVIPRQHGSKLSFNHDTIAAIRKAVKEIGKEAATHRFTPTEKKALLEIVFRYKQDGIKTSENEITRIAINYLIADFQQHETNSFLAEMLKSIYS